MLVTIDTGNTSTRIALFEGAKIRTMNSLPTPNLEIDPLRAVFRALRDAGAQGTIWISSVVPDANALIDSAATQYGFSTRFLRPATDKILPNALATPSTTGADRLLSALAAGSLYFPQANDGKGYVTIQCGSAATIDFVDSNGIFRGGFILPGPVLWMRALAGAAQLPDLSQEHPDWTCTTLGNSTYTSMMNGMTAALPSAVVAAARAIIPAQTPPVAVTGGWGATVADKGGTGFVYDPDLVLHGIRIVAQRSTENA